jgi:hypothetical protein
MLAAISAARAAQNRSSIRRAIEPCRKHAEYRGDSLGGISTANDVASGAEVVTRRGREQREDFAHVNT